MTNPDRVSTWRTNERADGLFGPAGGLAVWVRRDDLDTMGARAAARHGPTDPIECAMLLAQLRIGLDKLRTSLCAAQGWDAGTMAKMEADAADVLRPRLDSAARITDAKDET